MSAASLLAAEALSVTSVRASSSSLRTSVVTCEPRSPRSSPSDRSSRRSVMSALRRPEAAGRPGRVVGHVAVAAGRPREVARVAARVAGVAGVARVAGVTAARAGRHLGARAVAGPIAVRRIAVLARATVRPGRAVSGSVVAAIRAITTELAVLARVLGGAALQQATDRKTGEKGAADEDHRLLPGEPARLVDEVVRVVDPE